MALGDIDTPVCLNQVRQGDPDATKSWVEALYPLVMARDESRAPDSSPESAREWLGKMLTELCPEDRLVISLLDLEQKSVKEISALARARSPEPWFR